MTKEEWADIPGYENIYKVSSLGRVVAYAKSWNSGRWIIRSHPEKEIKLNQDRKGYFVVGLRKDGVQKMWKVHRLVAISFIPNPENKPQVNHKDANKRNNCVDNLEWATNSENMQHAHDNGLMNLKIGERHPMAKLNEADISIIRTSSLSTKELSKSFNVSVSTIKAIKGGKYWKHIL